MTDKQYSDLLKESKKKNPSCAQDKDALLDFLLVSRNELKQDLAASNGQRDRARAIADACARSLRRCCDDSKDFLKREEPDVNWVKSNIKFAEESLDLHEDRDWD